VRQRVWVGIESFALLLMIFYLIINQRKITISTQFNWLIITYFVGLTISIFSAYVFHHQSIIESLAGYTSFAFIILYYYLHKKRYKIKTLEKCILACGIIFQIIYWFEIKTNATLFGFFWGDPSTGVVRVMFNGRHIFILSYYLILSRFRLNIKSILLLLFSLSTILLMETRQLIIPALLITAYHFRSYILKSFITVIAIAATVTFVIAQNDTLITALIGKSQKEISENRIGADRWETAYYYLFAYNKNLFTRIFGDGLATPGSAYGNQMLNLGKETSFSPSDVGPLGYAAFLGIVWAISVILMVYKSLRIKTPYRFIYARYYMLNVLATLFFGEKQFVQASSIIVLAIVFYILDKTNYEMKPDRLEDNEAELDNEYLLHSEIPPVLITV